VSIQNPPPANASHTAKAHPLAYVPTDFRHTIDCRKTVGIAALAAIFAIQTAIVSELFHGFLTDAHPCIMAPDRIWA